MDIVKYVERRGKHIFQHNFGVLGRAETFLGFDAMYVFFCSFSHDLFGGLMKLRCANRAVFKK